MLPELWQPGWTEKTPKPTRQVVGTGGKPFGSGEAHGAQKARFAQSEGPPKRWSMRFFRAGRDSTKKQGGMLCQSVHINRGNAAAPRHTGFARA